EIPIGDIRIDRHHTARKRSQYLNLQTPRSSPTVLTPPKPFAHYGLQLHSRQAAPLKERAAPRSDRRTYLEGRAKRGSTPLRSSAPILLRLRGAGNHSNSNRRPGDRDNAQNTARPVRRRRASPAHCARGTQMEPSTALCRSASRTFL